MDEENMNLALVFFLFFSGAFLRILINLCLSLWAIMHANELAWD
jgi:hypothetical protein